MSGARPLIHDGGGFAKELPDTSTLKLPALASAPAAGANTGSLFRVGLHVYFDTGTAVVQVDQQSLAALLTSTVPSTPTDGTTLGLFDLNRGRPVPGFVDFSGFPVGLQTAFPDVRQFWAKAQGNGANTLNMFPGGTVTNYGTVVVSNTTLATPPGTTYLNTSKIIYIATNSTIGQVVAHQSTNAVQLGNATVPNAGGFYLCFKGAFNTTGLTGARGFCGATGTNGNLANVDPSTILNTIGFGMDAGDTVLQLMVNGASGTATKTPISTSLLTLLSGDFFDFRLFSPTGVAPAVYWCLSNLSNPTRTPVTGVITGAKLPTTAILYPRFGIGNGANAAAAQIGVQSYYFEEPA